VSDNAPNDVEAGELSAVGAARQLGLDLNYLYVLLRVGRMEGRKVDGVWRVSRRAVEARRARQREQEQEPQERQAATA